MYIRKLLHGGCLGTHHYHCFAFASLRVLSQFPYSRNWGYAPSGTLGTILLIVVILYLLKIV